MVSENSFGTRRWKRYRKYKDSGFEWLGEVPEGWDVKHLKYLSNKSLKYGSNETLVSDDRNNPRYIRITDINSDGSLRDNTFQSLSEESAEEFLLKTGDILFARSGATVGKTFIYDNSWGRCCFAGYLVRFRSDNKRFLPRFLIFFTNSQNYWDWISNVNIQSTIQNVSGEKYGNLSVPVPPFTEQFAITSFLDNKTAYIDTLIAKKEQQIEFLNEKRGALISHAVTKGINPDAMMKDSGIELIGEVPEHWKIIKTRYLFKLINEKAPNDNNLELISVYSDIGVKPRKELEARGNKASTTDGYTIVRKGDIIVNKLLAWMGAIGGSQYDGVTSPAYDILRKKVPLNSKFYDYLFRCGIYFPEFQRRSRGIMDMRWRLYFEELGDIPLVYPDLIEQNKIVDFLDMYIQQIDDIGEKILVSIDCLKEYRTALISAAVTGKIDVRQEISA
jgi:type I restriction enzyme S subunit